MKVALVGYGRMGREIEAVALDAGHEVVARLGREDPVTPESLRGAEVALEFTRPEAAPRNVVALARAGVDQVVGTTGWTERMDEARSAVEEAGTGMVWAPNFSIGVQLVFRLARNLGRLVEGVDAVEPYDAHVHEAHHRHKVDHPSGTGRRLAEILLEEMSSKRGWIPGPGEGAPDSADLLVTSTRAGEIAGTHVVGVEGRDDRIELRHEAKGRSGFARGALAAAEWIRGRQGVHDIDAMLTEMLGDAARRASPGANPARGEEG